MCIYIYIYTHTERERERPRLCVSQFVPDIKPVLSFGLIVNIYTRSKPFIVTNVAHVITRPCTSVARSGVFCYKGPHFQRELTFPGVRILPLSHSL